MAETNPSVGGIFDLALAHHRAGRLGEAEQLYRQILGQYPNHIDALQNLGLIAQHAGRFDAAVELIGRAVALSPNYAEAHSNLGNALKDVGRLDEAIKVCERAIALKPNLAEAHNNLGIALSRLARFDEAIAAGQRAIALRPELPESHNNLGIALAAKGRVDEAISACRQAIALRPGYADAYSNLGNALREKGLLDEGIVAYRQAIELAPDIAEPHNNLGIALLDQGLFAEAISSYRRAVQLKPDYVDARSNLLMALLYQSGDDGPLMLAEHRAWAEALARPSENRNANHTNDRSRNRRLRIGYVSADFRRHSVGYFLLPLLERHDRANFEIYCYSNSRNADENTERFKRIANGWRDIVDLSDEKAAALIRSDVIDILVDLSVHTRGHRLLAFARKPAPIQVTFLGYPGTTGLQAMDYRLTDPHLDPPEQPQEFYTERSVRLRRSYWCYRPSVEWLEITPLPAKESGFVTFGCLNNFSKVTPGALTLWAEILKNVPDSRLILHALPGSHRDRLRNTFSGFGIAPQRVSFVGWLPAAQYMDQYRRIDIGLDPFPFAGGTTTCDAQWMGVPVITLAGRTAIGRGGASVLNNVGAPELIAQSPERYLRLAIALAGDRARLDRYRTQLREQMRGSPLMDAHEYAADVEEAYRQMWHSWCVRSD